MIQLQGSKNEGNQTYTFPGSAGNLPNQSAWMPQRKLVRVDWKYDITVENEGEGSTITILTGTVDQAVLPGLLHRLYSLGLPLISIICVDCS